MHTIRRRWRTYYTGETADGKQILFGWTLDFIAALLFDRAGDLVETRDYPFDWDIKQGLGPAAESKASARIQELKREFGIRPKPIRVKPFELPEWHIGLRQFPEDLAAFLEDPKGVSAEDVPVYRADLERWQADGNCVLRWGNEYALDRDGRTI